VGAIGSVSLEPIVKYAGRAAIFSFGAIINITLIITMLYWKPNPENPSIFFVVAGFWGFADSIWQTQINGTPKIN